MAGVDVVRGTKRAAIYVRVSTLDQELGPQAQEANCRAYCALKGLDVAAVYIDQGVSGRIPFAERPAGAKLLAELATFDAIVCAKLDRAFRDTVDTIMTVDAWRAAGKAVHFLDLGIDTTTAAGQLCLEMMAAMAKFERTRISERTKDALAVNRRLGKPHAAPALGFRRENGQNVVDLEEYRVVERAKALLPELGSANRVAQALNEEGFRTRRGSCFTHVQVGRMLSR